MSLVPDVTLTRCPYCNRTTNGDTHYIYRIIEIGELSPYAPKIKAVELYCAACQHTLSITPIVSAS